MKDTINTNSSINSNAPMIESFMVPKDKIREIIGAGGKIIREICDSTGARVDIADDGKVSISAIGKDKLDAAILRVKEIAIDPEIGDIFEGKVVKVLDAGAFINYSGSRDGFVHISEIAHERIESVAGALTEGQVVKVKLIGFDRGKAKLTIKNVEAVAIPAKNENKSGKENQPPSNDVKQNNVKDEKPTKREVGKKWKKRSDDLPPEIDIKERKYFN
jgi:polyribonucleotide nucleotidyltransferase